MGSPEGEINSKSSMSLARSTPAPQESRTVTEGERCCQCPEELRCFPVRLAVYVGLVNESSLSNRVFRWEWGQSTS